MLYFIKGRAGSGKTGCLHKKIISQLNTSGSKPLLIIPEQFSFETERAMLKLLGPKKSKELEIFSFSRLAFSVLKNTEAFNKKIIDDGIRAVLMSEAITSLEGRLSVFSSEKVTLKNLSPLMDFYKELKQCSISAHELENTADELPDGFLKEKMQDASLIYQAFDALVEQSYFDNTDAISLLTDYARKNGCFKNRTIYFDGFRMFSKQELECFSVILSQADNVYVTLCEDKDKYSYGPFNFIYEFENSLRAIANTQKISVDDSEICVQSEQAFSSDIFTLEKNIYNEANQVEKDCDGNVVIAECIDKYDECKYVAATIRRLVRSGEYRYKDIAIIERTSGEYKGTLIEELKYYGIPVFEDSVRSLKYEALFVYVNAMLSCIVNGFTIENVFNYLKSGLCNVSLKSVSDLEKYALMWKLKGEDWSKDFTKNPMGFAAELDESACNKLEKLNAIRKSVVEPVIKLKEDCKNKTGEEITRLIFEFVDSQNIRKNLYRSYTLLKSDGYPVEAERQAVSWDAFVSLLDKIATIGEGKYLSLSRWYELYCLLVDSSEIGEIPQGLDEIKIGSADRIRTDKLKVVFLVGVNNEEFPLVSVKGGILTDSERATLTEMALPIHPSYINSISEERFIAYCALTAACQKLYLSYKTVSAGGDKLYPSEIIKLAQKSLNGVKVFSTASCDALELVESDEDAFSLLARNYNNNSDLKKILEEYFASREEYADRLQALRNIVGDRRYTFKDSKIAEKLFRKNIKLSASKIETYYNCPFSYFVQYGLNIDAWREAKLDSANNGTIIHHVLEKLLNKYYKNEFASSDVCQDSVCTGTPSEFEALTEDELKAEITDVLDEYKQSRLGSVVDDDKRLSFLYSHIIDVCMMILLRMQKELSLISFKPIGFEVEIGGEKESSDQSENGIEGNDGIHVPYYRLPLDSGEVLINGKIDRVDGMIDSETGNKYLRVIDYKSGSKTFSLCNLLDGINLQMVLYLVALKKLCFADYKPAAVLYLPSKISFDKYLKERSPDSEKVSNAKSVGGKFSGMILEDEKAFGGMGYDSDRAEEIKRLLPGSMKKEEKGKKGQKQTKISFSYNTYSEKAFEKLAEHIDNAIINMGNNLHNGIINAIPWGTTKDGGDKCSFCSYRAMCGYEDGYKEGIREKNSLKHSEAIKALGGDDDGQQLDA